MLLLLLSEMELFYKGILSTSNDTWLLVLSYHWNLVWLAILYHSVAINAADPVCASKLNVWTSRSSFVVADCSQKKQTFLGKLSIEIS